MMSFLQSVKVQTETGQQEILKTVNRLKIRLMSVANLLLLRIDLKLEKRKLSFTD